MQLSSSVNGIRSTARPNGGFGQSFNLKQLMMLWQLRQQHLESVCCVLTLSLEYLKCRKGLLNLDVVIFG